MTKRMLIDATHPEGSRVVVVSGTHVEEFDFESPTKQRIKGNVYLAKVTRVEPSLQAAFIDYGGARHGFLAFNEIHPDYYQIPVDDRRALLEAPEAAEEEAGNSDAAPKAEGEEEEAPADDGEAEGVETLGGDEVEELTKRRIPANRRYKIQEVIKRGQILLVQVVKDERGTKGAALTTFISLAGLYCVLMPNALRSTGGISRRIADAKDRQRLRTLLSGLDVPEGMGLILRTAAQGHTRTEIRRDYENLLRLWDKIRENTLNSVAPALVNEESNLIKRSIRDVYTRDIDEVLVEGDAGYRMAKDYMKSLMPSHARKVQPYRDSHIPLFHRFQVESQLDAIHNMEIRLKSGGYLVIHPTEALVAIDVNSGRATRERNIEQTATRTNLEAAEEIPRQLRLRDLGGLIVIDFIDMDVAKNRRAVERQLKESMKNDRARIQIGHISVFGMLELSRQRLRPSVLEASTTTCPNCGGSGTVRSTESTALQVLRAIEEEGMRRHNEVISVAVPTSVAFYLLNQKRSSLSEIEARHDFRVTVSADDSLIPPAYRLEPVKARSVEAGKAAVGEPAVEEARRPRRSRRRRKESEPSPEAVGEAAVEEPGETEGAAIESGEPAAAAEDKAPRKRRRRGRRGGRRRSRRDSSGVTGETVASAVELPHSQAVESQPLMGEAAESPEAAGASLDDSPAAVAGAPVAEGGAAEATPETAEKETKKARRRAPRRRVRKAKEALPESLETVGLPESPESTEPATPQTAAGESEAAAEKPRRVRRPRKRATAGEEVEKARVADEAAPQAEPAPKAEKPKRATRRRKPRTATAAKEEAAPAAAAPAESPEPLSESAALPAAAKPSRPRRQGWWQRVEG
jgi:ribonuclease E